MLLIGVSGKRGSGKDTLCDILVEEHNFTKISFADMLKNKVREDFGLTIEQTDGKLKETPTIYNRVVGGREVPWTSRQIMIEYCKFFRTIDPDFWVKATFNLLNTLESYGKLYGKLYGGTHPLLRFCFSDVRFPNEADRIHSYGGKVVRLERKDELNIYKEKLNDSSETALDYYAFDAVLPSDQNIDRDDLREFANILVNYLHLWRKK